MLTWNALGQLTQVVTTRGGQSRTTTYVYDGLERRTRKETAGVVREYVYNGDQLVLEVDGQGHDLAEYSYYPEVDAPHSMRRKDAAGNWQTYYYLMETPGHVVGLISLFNSPCSESYRVSSPMNRENLKQALEQLQVNPYMHALDGENKPDTIVLEREGSTWIVYYRSERGSLHDRRTFGSENEACTYVYEQFAEMKRLHHR